MGKTVDTLENITLNNSIFREGDNGSWHGIINSVETMKKGSKLKQTVKQRRV